MQAPPKLPPVVRYKQANQSSSDMINLYYSLASSQRLLSTTTPTLKPNFKSIYQKYKLGPIMGEGAYSTVYSASRIEGQAVVQSKSSLGGATRVRRNGMAAGGGP